MAGGIDDFNIFHHELSLVVSSSEVNFHGARAYIQKYVTELMPRGNNSNSRVMLLSGSHGFSDGTDALCDVKALESMNDANDEMIHRQTRKFYEAWCKFFKLEVEGEDPRIYDLNGQAQGVVNLLPPAWKARYPRLPGLWKDNLATGKNREVDEGGLQIKIVDVSWYTKKIEDLLKLIKDFHPTTLIIDWCFTRRGFTMEKITTSGIASKLRMETEMFLGSA